jgi:hypothetical protein
VHDVQGRLEVGEKYSKHGIQVVRESHGHLCGNDEDLLVRMVDEDVVSRREVIDARTGV